VNETELSQITKVADAGDAPAATAGRSLHDLDGVVDAALGIAHLVGEPE
jgi:hypothetical protein